MRGMREDMNRTPINPLFPLDTFYFEACLPLPRVQFVEGGAVPEPYKRLLVGEHDMTPTLEAFHGDTIELTVLNRHLDGDAYSREVLLHLVESGRPVEFGAIVINLQHFPGHARELVIEGHCPLGTILATEGIEHASCPQAFIEVIPDATIRAGLGMSKPTPLYGRRNILVTKDDRILANIVEILPP